MSNRPASIFHLAFTVTDLAAARVFYTDPLGSAPGISSEDWIILEVFGHKATAYIDRSRSTNEPVHDDDPDMRHFGTILSRSDFLALTDRLQGRGQEFMIPPTLRDGGTENENWIMMLRDPAGNVLEFDAVLSRDRVFSPC